MLWCLCLWFCCTWNSCFLDRGTSQNMLLFYGCVSFHIFGCWCRYKIFLTDTKSITSSSRTFYYWEHLDTNQQLSIQRINTQDANFEYFKSFLIPGATDLFLKRYLGSHSEFYKLVFFIKMPLILYSFFESLTGWWCQSCFFKIKLDLICIWVIHGSDLVSHTLTDWSMITRELPWYGGVGSGFSLEPAGSSQAETQWGFWRQTEIPPWHRHGNCWGRPWPDRCHISWQSSA